jgi:ATP-dependent Lhr-like helicase
LLRSQVEEALAELVANGVVVSDSFAGLRALLTPAAARHRQRRAGNIDSPFTRWRAPALVHPATQQHSSKRERSALTEEVAWALLKRYG